MLKKKEVLIIILIIITIIAVSILPNLNLNNDEVNINIEEPNNNVGYVEVTVVGEIIVESITYTVPYGSSYSNLIKYLKNITNDYSIIDSYNDICFKEDTTITILSTDDNRLSSYNLDYKISINTANKSELIKIYGIGEKRSEKIIEYRKSNKISSFSELKSLLGVSDEIIERIKEEAIL